MFKAEKIRELCKVRGFTLSKLAGEIGISNQGIQSMLKNNVTTIATLEKICNVLDVTPNYFFEYESDKPRESHLNLGTINTQYAAGSIRDSSMNVVSEPQHLPNSSNEIESLKKEIDYLRQQLIDKEQLIAMQKEFIENLKRQVK